MNYKPIAALDENATGKKVFSKSGGAKSKEGAQTTFVNRARTSRKPFQKLVDEKKRKGCHVSNESNENAEKPKIPFIKTEMRTRETKIFRIFEFRQSEKQS